MYFDASNFYLCNNIELIFLIVFANYLRNEVIVNITVNFSYIIVYDLTHSL